MDAPANDSKADGLRYENGKLRNIHTLQYLKRNNNFDDFRDCLLMPLPLPLPLPMLLPMHQTNNEQSIMDTILWCILINMSLQSVQPIRISNEDNLIHKMGLVCRLI